MNEKTVLKNLIDSAVAAAGVPAVHAPATSAGEKIIWRTTPGKRNGSVCELALTMRFISAHVDTALERAAAVTNAICTVGDSPESGVTVTREGTDGSGYISRTGHFFVLVRYRVRGRAE